MSEKIRVKNGSTYDLVTNGAFFGEEKAKLIVVFPSGKTFEQIEADFEGNERIQILGEDGEVDETKVGYAYIDESFRKKNYVIGTEQVADGVNDTGETIYVNKDVTATVMIIVLKKADLRTELEKAKAEIANLNETVDMLVVSALEG